MMPCYHPVTAYWTKRSSVTGKRGITFSPALAFDVGDKFDVPCNGCTGCRLEKSRQWAMRCLHEARLHPENVFVTLTYRPEELPPGNTLVKRDFQLFMKRLRKLKGEGIRFFGCGEYGDENNRPHYHAILFNCAFSDKVRIGQSRRGEPLFYSKELEKVWPVGFNTIGAVSFDSAAYVARYCMKKIVGKGLNDDSYTVVDVKTGEIFRREPVFALMSRRPGVGTGYYEKYGHEVRNHDSVIVNGKEVKPPRFYDVMTEKADPRRMKEIKIARARKAYLMRGENVPLRRAVRETIADRRLELKERKL